MRTADGKDRKQVAKQEAKETKKTEEFHEKNNNNKNAHHNVGADHENGIVHSSMIMMLLN